MKKKLLIALFMVIIACLLSITAFAANEVTLVGGEKVDFETVFKVEKSGGVDNVVTGYKTGYNSNSVTDVIFPEYLAGIESNGLFGRYANPASTTIRTLTFEATDEFFISGDNIFSGISVTKVTFNPDCVVEMRKGSFSGCTNLTEITFPKFRKLSSNAFSNCSNMVATNPIILVEGMTEISGDAFHGCSKLNVNVVFPSTLKTIKDEVFRSSGFESFDFSNCTNLTSFDSAVFSQCDSLTTLDLSGCVNLTNLSSSFAEGCDVLVNVILPSSLTNIPYKAFAHCYKLQSIVLPESLTYVADEAFHSARNDQNIKTFTVYLQSYVEFHSTNSFRDSSAKIEYILIKNSLTAEEFVAKNTYNGITGATVVDYQDPLNPWTYTAGQAITSHTIVENYCKALAINGEHQSENNPCVINCSICGLTSLKENPQHVLSIKVSYDDGYNKVGIKHVYCESKGCTHSVTEEMPALFTCFGYSVAEYANGISVGYAANNNAIDKYMELTGKTLNYGVFAVLKDKLGENEIFTGDKAADGVLTNDLTSHRFDIFEFKISGFTDSQKDTMLAIGAFVKVTGENGTEYSYLQIGAKAENEKYVFVSYNDLIK